MNAQTIMVQVADHNWTSEAIHSACMLARRTGAEVALVQMVPVQHPGWLGTELGYRNFTEKDGLKLQAYKQTLEDYGIRLSVQIMQYVTLAEALVQAAENVNAQIVFAHLPRSFIPYWHSFQMGMLRRRLARQQRQLVGQATVVPEPPVEEPDRVSQPRKALKF